MENQVFEPETCPPHSRFYWNQPEFLERYVRYLNYYRQQVPDPSKQICKEHFERVDWCTGKYNDLGRCRDGINMAIRCFKDAGYRIDPWDDPAKPLTIERGPGKKDGSTSQ